MCDLDPFFKMWSQIAIDKFWNASKFNIWVYIYSSKLSWGNMSSDPSSISMFCMLIMLCTIQPACVSIIWVTTFPYSYHVQKFPVILPDQHKIVSSMPELAIGSYTSFTYIQISPCSQWMHTYVVSWLKCVIT